MANGTLPRTLRLWQKTILICVIGASVWSVQVCAVAGFGCTLESSLLACSQQQQEQQQHMNQKCFRTKLMKSYNRICGQQMRVVMHVQCSLYSVCGAACSVFTHIPNIRCSWHPYTHTHSAIHKMHETQKRQQNHKLVSDSIRSSHYWGGDAIKLYSQFAYKMRSGMLLCS